MPLPMVHLSVAVALCEKMGCIPSPDFLLGNIAPDAIHMRPNTDKHDKERVHLIDGNASPQELVRSFRTQFGLEESRVTGFSAGYLTHLLTDLFWRQAVIDPFRKKLPPAMPDKEVRKIYYRDTDQIDFDLFRQMPWRPQAWLSLRKAVAEDFYSLLTGAEILQWRDRTLDWYDDPGHDPKVEPAFMTLAGTHTFIKQAGTQISGIGIL